jgi:transposase
MDFLAILKVNLILMAKKYKTNFRDYNQGQGLLFPPHLEDFIPENHLVRVINQVIDHMDTYRLYEPFHDEGNPPYHPKMMLKVLIYAYSIKIFTSRKIARALRQDVTFMWLSGLQRPDFNTVNRFRGDYLKDVLEDVFTEVLDFLYDHGYVRFEDHYVDGSKMEADANKYSYIWKKNTARYKSAVKERVKGLLKEIEELNEQEDLKYGGKDLEELGQESQITSKKVKEVAEKINKELEEKGDNDQKKTVNRKVKSRVKRLKKESEKLAGYEEQESIARERNSYSKTDHDATFMRMKDDQLKPGYNIQVSTENQFITNFSVSQNAADSASFVDHLEKIENRGEKYLPKTYTGDSGYGCGENYEVLEGLSIDSYLKYNTFHYEETSAYKKNIFHKDNMLYDPQNDRFICPSGKMPTFREEKEVITSTGYLTCIRIYECESCEGCPFKSRCTKSETNRTIQVNRKLEAYKEKMRKNLNSEKGIVLRKRRGIEVETFFGDLKHNQEYRRFKLRGLEKVNTELAWHCLSYNIRKLHKAVELNKKVA